jgi:glycosyltransferase involved in cell wall biosynthesis
LHLSPDIEFGDPGRDTVDLAVLTQRAGWRAVIASSGGRLVTEAERAAVLHKKMPLDRPGPINNWRNRLQLEATLQAERPALLHAHGIESIPYALALGRAHGIPIVVDLTQPLADLPRTKHLFDILKSARAMLRVPSNFMAWHLEDVFGVGEQQMCLVPPGIDLQSYSVGFISPERLQKISHLWRLPEQGTIILAPMPLLPEMGHRVFLEVLSMVRNENAYTVLVGSDRHAPGMRKEVEEMIGSYGLNGRVIMPDDCPDLPAACWLANVIVAPNIGPRGQNLELLAAQAIGRPVIVTDSGANREMSQSGRTAWVVPTGDVHAMVSALREAINLNTAQRLALAERTHNFVAETFPQSAWFNGMMELYESLLYPARQISRTANVA